MKHYEDHPFVTELKRYVGSDDDEIIAQTARTNFATFDQSWRTQLLIETEKLVGADERASRQNGQLLNLTRELRNLDRMMRAAGR
jgi:hypothetical protein